MPYIMLVIKDTTKKTILAIMKVYTTRFSDSVVQGGHHGKFTLYIFFHNLKDTVLLQAMCCFSEKISK